MKKLLGTLIVFLVLCTNAYSEIYELINCKPNAKRLLKQWGPTDVKIDTSNKTITYSSSGQPFKYDTGTLNTGFKFTQRPFFSDVKGSYAEYIFSPLSKKIIVRVYSKTIWQKNVSYNEFTSNEMTHNCDSSIIPETKIAEKPKKKKKPKPSPDDDKIVPAGSGSGFFVLKDGTVITNYHVIEGCELNKVSYKGSQSEAKVLSIDKVNDIAILKTNINPENAFTVSNEDVSLLEDVVVAGYPLGKQISSAIKTHKGVVTALAGAGDNYSYFQTDAAINQGNSGGPIINQKGNVVGIAVQTWVEEGVQGVHFGIKSSTLKTFASANGLKFLAPNNRDLSNKELGKLITESTVYVECHMTIAKIKKMLAESENKKAFFKEHK